MNYTEKEMEDCFTAGVKFARDMMNNPSNSEYMMQIKNEKQVKNNIVLADVSGQLPSFLYEDRGEVIVGVHGDAVVTDDWNKWKEGNLR